MQRLDHLLVRVLVPSRHRVVLVQETVQIREVREDLRADEVEQREELLQVVLQLRAGDEQPSAAREGTDDLREHRVDVLDTMRLVDYDVLEGELFQGGLLDETDLVRGDADVEVVGDEPVLDRSRAFLFGARDDDTSLFRRPSFELLSPVLKGRLWDDDEARAWSVAMMPKVTEERYCLQCLSKTHFVSENAVEAVVVKRDHPVETLDLIGSHRAVDDCGRWSRLMERSQRRTDSADVQLGDSSNTKGRSPPSTTRSPSFIISSSSFSVFL